MNDWSNWLQVTSFKLQVTSYKLQVTSYKLNQKKQFKLPGWFRLTALGSPWCKSPRRSHRGCGLPWRPCPSPNLRSWKTGNNIDLRNTIKSIMHLFVWKTTHKPLLKIFLDEIVCWLLKFLKLVCVQISWHFCFKSSMKIGGCVIFWNRL